MKEARVVLRGKAGEEALVSAVNSEAQRIVIVVETDDKVSAVEKLRNFLLSNVSKTIIVYASNPGGGDEV